MRWPARWRSVAWSSGPTDFFPSLRLGGRPTTLGPLEGDAEVDGAGKLVPYQAMLRGAMEQALVTHGSIRAAANHLGMAKSTFADKARAWGLLPRSRFKPPKQGG